MIHKYSSQSRPRKLHFTAMVLGALIGGAACFYNLSFRGDLSFFLKLIIPPVVMVVVVLIYYFGVYSRSDTTKNKEQNRTQHSAGNTESINRKSDVGRN